MRYVVSTALPLKILNSLKYSAGCGNFCGFVYKETESQEIVWTFTTSCGGECWPEHSET